MLTRAQNYSNLDSTLSVVKRGIRQVVVDGQDLGVIPGLDGAGENLGCHVSCQI